MTAIRPAAGVTRAGTSARAKYETERKAWIRRNRRLFWTVDLVAGVVIAATIIGWIAWRPGGWYLGLIAGFAGAFVVMVHTRPPWWIEKWQVGAWGEQRTAAELAKLPPGWHVAHDVKRRRGGANVDHVLVGPAGVYVIDTKNLSGTAAIAENCLTLTYPDGGHAYTNDRWAPNARTAAYEVYQRLGPPGERPPVQAVMAVWADMPQRHVVGNHVEWISGHELTGWLCERPTTMSQEKVEQIWSTLQELPSGRR